MAANFQSVFEFDRFRFDADTLVLYHSGEIVRGAEKHSLEVLAVLLRSDDRVASYDDIIDSVWHDVEYGVDASRVNQHISKLRNLLAKYEPDTEYFENLRGRGYRFTGKVSTPPRQGSSETDFLTPHPSAAGPASRRKAKWLVPLLSLAIVGFAGAFLWKLYPPKDVDEVSRVVKESQMYESLTLYRQPESFKESDLDKYWTAEADVNANYDRGRIRDAVKKLINEGRKYGEESKCEQFDFQSVEIAASGNQAVVRTIEKWMIADYTTDGTLLRIKNVGPYFVDYALRKIDGRWLIEKSTTARTVRPTPRLDLAIPVTQPAAGREFLLNLTGNDLEPVTIYLEVTGPGCPEAKPCKIDNGALLERAKLSTTALESVPLKLASGEFRIIARNGDSKPSNPVTVTVP